jgi:hypothetical protein
MKILQWCLSAAIVAAALTAGGLKYREQGLDGEVRRLRRGNNRLRSEAYRRQANRTTIPAPEAPVAVAAPAAKPTEAAPRAVEEYRNEGRATARAALQTLAWCCDRGDVAALVQLTQLEPEARAKAEAYYASLPADVRSRWKSADEMVATLLSMATQMSPFPSADVLDAAAMEPAGDDRMLLRVPGTNKDRLPFRRAADGEWSFVLDAALMDQLFAVAKNLAAATR